VKRSKNLPRLQNLRFFEIAFVLVRFNHVASDQVDNLASRIFKSGFNHRSSMSKIDASDLRFPELSFSSLLGR